MFCINCGATLPADATFCTECGSALVAQGEAPASDRAVSDRTEEAPAEAPDGMEDIRSVSAHMKDDDTDALPPLPSLPEERGYVPPPDDGEAFEPRPGYDDNFVYVEDYEASRPQRGHRWLFVAIPVFLAVVGVAVAIILWWNAPMQRLDRALSAEDYSAVTAAVNSLSESDRREASARLVTYAESALERFNSGEVDFDAAYTLVDRVQRLFPSAGLDAVLAELNALKASKESFASGEQFETDGDLVTAIARYGAVLESDALYEDAQSGIERIRSGYKKEALQKADTLEAEKNFQGAIAALNATHDILGDDADITARIEALQGAEVDAYVNEALEAAAKRADSGDYPGALAVLADSEKRDDQRIQKQISTYRTQYKSQEMEKAAELAGTGSYEEAVAVLEALAETLTDDTEIAEQIDAYEALYPVSLLNLSPSAGSDLSSGWTATDAAGNSYTGGLSFSLYPTAMSATTSYAANGGYELLSGTWIVESESDADFIGSVRIYVDEVLVYEVNSLTVNSAPLQLNLKISGASTVRMEASASFDSPRSSGYIFLAGPTFRN